MPIWRTRMYNCHLMSISEKLSSESLSDLYTGIFQPGPFERTTNTWKIVIRRSSLRNEKRENYQYHNYLHRKGCGYCWITIKTKFSFVSRFSHVHHTWLHRETNEKLSFYYHNYHYYFFNALVDLINTIATKYIWLIRGTENKGKLFKTRFFPPGNLGSQN